MNPREVGPRPVLWRELAIGVGLLGVYVVVRLLDGATRRTVADDHALGIARLEQRLGIDVEAALNRWLAPQGMLTTLANYEYALGYLLVAAMLIVWAGSRRPRDYPFVRNSFVFLNLVGMAVFLFYPVTPPRLLPQLGLVDTVRQGRTFGSWGSPWMEYANQLAAMPSMHVAWVLWVSVMLAQLNAMRWVQLVSAANVAVTTVVALATANHFVLDAVAGAVVVPLGVVLARGWDRRPGRVPGQVVPAADAFFAYVESATAPQQVGGLVFFAPSPDDRPDLDDVRRRLGLSLADLPAFRRRLVPGSRWRRPRWVQVASVDLDWHVQEHDLGAAGDRPALLEYVADLTATPLPTDRPMWRLVVIRGVAEHQSGMVILVHHTIADGLGVIAAALRFLDPPIGRALESDVTPPGALRRLAATTLGVAQLATDGSPRAPLSRTTSATREFGVTTLDLELVRSVAQAHGSHVTDVLLCAVAGAISRRRPDLGEEVESRLRVAVPLLVADPGRSTGNLTSGVMLDLPLGTMPEARRLALVTAGSHRLRTPSRALASRMVVARGLAWMPPPAARWFVHTVYGHRFFHAIITNMIGPSEQLWLAGARLTEVIPILPLAPGAPLAVGALGWNGRLGIGVATDPAVLAADGVCAALEAVVAELAAASGPTRPNRRKVPGKGG